MSVLAFDPVTGMRKRRSGEGFNQQSLIPDTDPTGRIDIGGGGVSPTSPTTPSYANLLNIPGTQPDWLGILNSDPLLAQFRRGLGAESIGDASQRDALIRQALARFGLVPEAAGQYADAETRSLAELNTKEGLSTVARLNRELERVRQNVMDSLAARGALRSGATGIAQGELQQEYKESLTDAESQLLDYISGAQRAFVDAERQRAREIAQAQQEAAGRIDPAQAGGTPAQQAVHIGGGIYRSPDGQLWNADGTLYSPSAAPQQPVAPPPLISPPPVPQLGGGGGRTRAL